MSEKRISYFKQDAIGQYGLNELTVIELFFYVILMLNLSIVVYYPAYEAIYRHFSLAVYIFVVLAAMSQTAIQCTILQMIGLAAFVAMSVMAIMFNHSGMGVVTYYLWPLSIIYMFKYADLSDKYFERITLFMFAAWIISVLSAPRVTETFRYYVSMEIYGGKINPNTTAIVAAYTCLFLASWMERTTKALAVKLILYAVTLIAIIITRSRTSLVAFVTMLIFEACFKQRLKTSRTFALVFMGILIISGILFPVVYVNLFKNGIIAGETDILGKDLFTGRQYIWMSLWEYLKVHKTAWAWGTGFNTGFYFMGSFNLHNAYLQVFAQFGLPVLLAYLGYIFYCVNYMYGQRGELNDRQFKCLQMVLMTLYVGYSETILTYLPTVIFYALALGIGCREAERSAAA